MKKAIIYVSHIDLNYCNASICCDEQLERILKYCRDHDIDAVDVVKEIGTDEDPMNRPGIKSLLGKCRGADYVVVERPWCLSRRASLLDRFLRRLDQVGVRLVCATHLWDCASQYVRRFHYSHAAAVPCREDKIVSESKAG
jgi:DNA invertase Pin-like site-specific DNA recombinase